MSVKESVPDDYDDLTTLLPTLRDVHTGAVATAKEGGCLWWWSEGNGSCDCNRAAAFDHANGDQCTYERYRVIDIQQIDDADTKARYIACMNGCYPDP